MGPPLWSWNLTTKYAVEASHLTSNSEIPQTASASKIMALVFWDSEGILIIDYLEWGKAVTGAYYAELIRKLCEEIKEKYRGKLAQGVLLHHDNASAHTSHVAMATIHTVMELLASNYCATHHILLIWDHLIFIYFDFWKNHSAEGINEVVIQAINEWIQGRSKPRSWKG